MARKNSNGSTAIEIVKHKDKRVNIPTEELRDFVAEDEKNPKSIRYPRDPSLDPQLVWKGKDEQDAKDLEVPAVPVYIQEKVHPQAIIEDLRRSSPRADEQFNLFSDFNGIKFEDQIDFYHHQQNWSNRLILGDSLLVMTSLAEKEGLKGKVQMIYFDPPYGIKFGSNWQVSTRKRDVKDGKADDLTRQPEQIRAFRDTWKLGIHSYLAYLRDRLVVARELLTETGSVFVQIGDENVHLVRCLLDEVFGSENFINLISVVKRSPQPDDFLSSVTDYLLWYGKNRDFTKFRSVYKEKIIPEYEDSHTTSDLTSSHFYDSAPFEFQGRIFTPRNRYWSTSPQGLNRIGFADRLSISGNTIRYKRFHKDFKCMIVGNNWSDVALSNFGDEKVYVVQTASKVIERCLLMTTDPGDLVLDPTMGSGTTAYVAEQWGRRWITIDTSRVALALARTRLMAARFPYYLLADSPEGRKKEAEVTGKVPPITKTDGDIRKGFVYKQVPHITLKSIANNAEIDAIHAKWQEQLEPVLNKLNAALKQKWQEWQVPLEVNEKWPAEAKKLHEEFWRLRRERQKEIDAAISRNADTEVLYDQPYEDNKRIRVTGPFTVESLSPHRTLSTEDDSVVAGLALPKGAASSAPTKDPSQFVHMILDNLRKAGVQNTRKNERLKFDRLEPFAGEWLHAAGEYTDSDGTLRRAAVCIGPEHGTVDGELIKDAAKETLKGVGFDLLIICGFAFDAHANETAKEFTPSQSNQEGFAVAEGARQYGKLPILLAKMNPDLAMGDELLKSTGAGNLFMVFGEPDVFIAKKDGMVQAELRGVDIYDPTTGQIRSSSTEEIACWFIDTDYNEESFFVRHAYFTGADQPYERLKRALRAEIDEAAWSSLYSTVSRPFDMPKTGKIAVKVINHYGDEVLKVFEV